LVEVEVEVEIILLVVVVLEVFRQMTQPYQV